MRTQPERKLSRRAHGCLLSLGLLLLAGIPHQVSGRSVQNHVLGLRIGMSREVVHGRLRKMGTLQKEERGRQEVWALTSEPRFSSVLVGFDANFKVRYVTAIAREGGPRVRYSELAPIKEAYAENANGAYTRYTWKSKPGKRTAGYFLIAEGRDPEYLKSFSIKRYPQQ